MSETPLRICMLGEFTLSYGDTTIVDQHCRSGKLWTVLEYLVTFRNRDLSQEEIIQLLWPEEEDTTAPANTLKTLLHRARTQLAQLGNEDLRNTITYRRGTYQWAPQVPCTVDVDDFDVYCKLASNTDDELRKLDYLLSAIHLYKGDFLHRSAMEHWVMPINVYYRSQYIKIVYEALALLTQQGNFSTALELCQKAVAIDPYDEGLHLQLIKCLLATGAQRAALEHYKQVTDLFYTKFGTSPSDEMTAIYRDVVQTDRDMELDLSIIKENLEETPGDGKAFLCEYEFFKEIYRLKARTILRTGQVIHIALVTVSSNSDTDLTQKQLNTTMERLRDIISDCLRRSDAFARYSVNQYLAMLPSANYENGQMIMNRIVSAFRGQYPKMPVSLQYKILPLDPFPEP